MAFRTWARIMLAALGVGALAGASQLGMAYGLGLVRLTRLFDVTARDQWTAQLAWVAWFAMVAAVIGALAGGWLVPRWRPTAVYPPGPVTAGLGAPGLGAPNVGGAGVGGADVGSGPVLPARAPRLSVGTMLGLAFSAAVGASIVVPLTMQPARTAQVIGVNPALVIGICAGLGALVGAFAGYAALAAVMSRWSLGSLITAVWVIAIVSVLPSLGLKDQLPAVRLGVFDAGYLSPATTQRTALFTMPALALLAGAGLGWMARRQGRPPLTIALAGLPGPALLTLAYLIAGPGEGGHRYQMVPYWAAMTATGAGVLGSVLAAVLRRGEQDDEPDGTPGTSTDTDPTTTPDAGRPPLPRQADGPGKDPDATSPDLAAGLSAAHSGDPHSGAPKIGSPDTDVPGTDSPEPGSPKAKPGSLKAKPRSPKTESGSPQTESGPSAPAPVRPDPFGPELNPPGSFDPGPRRSFEPDPLRPLNRRPDDGRPDTRTGGGRPADPEPFNAWSEPGRPAPGDTGSLRREQPSDRLADRFSSRPPTAPAEAAPYVPAPAIPPFPPEAAQQDIAPPAPSRFAGGSLGRGLRNLVAPAGQQSSPFASQPQQVAPAPAVPQQISAPLPHPNPVSAPLPRPEPITPPTGTGPGADDGRRSARGGPVQKKDEDYVDWVSGLGSD